MAATPTSARGDLRDPAREARDVRLPFLEADRDDPSWAPGPIVIEGVDPPALLERIWRGTRAAPNGHAPALLVVQSDPAELEAGLAALDEPALLDDPRVTLFVGEDASAQLAAHLHARLHLALPRHGVRAPTLRRAAAPALPAVLKAAHAAQRAEQDRLARIARDRYRGHDRTFWRERFRAALDGRGEPLRILLPVSRYSTFVRHAAADLAAAFEALGHEPRVLSEPDDHHTLTAVAHLRELAEWGPDVVILINHTRAQLAGTLPDEVPVVGWVQDQMVHLFDPATGVKAGPLDFVIGAVDPRLAARFDGAAGRFMLCPVAASSRTFHDGAVASAARRRYECEIAYVSHASETPEAAHARRLEAVPEGSLRDALHGLLDGVRTVVERAMIEVPSAALLELAGGTLRSASAGGAPSPHAVATLLHQWCVPLAERVIRQETLGWAADLAEERGWRLHLYGRGWNDHERLGAHARGELTHDEALRAAYRCAVAHLHMSVNTNVHQRVLECALSGGLPLCRLTMNDLAAINLFAMTRAAARPERLCGAVATRLHGAWIVDHPEFMRYTALLQRLGVDGVCHGMPVFDELLEPQRAPIIAEELCPDWLLGDLAETTFRDRATLERCLDRAIERPAARRAQTTFVARRVRARLTHDALARRIVALLADGLT